MQLKLQLIPSVEAGADPGRAPAIDGRVIGAGKPGPITGREFSNGPAFERAYEFLVRKGHSPINPHALCRHHPADSSHADYMEMCLGAIGRCQAIYMLPGWEQSKGARMEYREATERGMCIWYAAEEA